MNHLFAGQAELFYTMRLYDGVRRGGRAEGSGDTPRCTLHEVVTTRGQCGRPQRLPCPCSCPSCSPAISGHPHR